MSFRKEKKYKLTIYEFNFLKNRLIRNGMRKLFETRFVNSLYYDTSSNHMFHHSEEGVLPRKNVRIRWYGSNNQYSIENKISSIEGRYKINLALKEDLSKGFPKTLIDQSYGLLEPSLLVSYERNYYLFKGLRITFDSFIKYKNYRIAKTLEFEDPERVMEIKTSAEASEDFIENLFPYSSTRFSKYSRGLLLSQNQN